VRKSIIDRLPINRDSIRLGRLGRTGSPCLLRMHPLENVILSNYKTVIVPFAAVCFEILSIVLAPFFLRFMNA
jgi:hypothetical protein